MVADANHVGEEHAGEHAVRDFTNQEFDGLFLVLRAGHGVIALLIAGEFYGIGLPALNSKRAPTARFKTKRMMDGSSSVFQRFQLERLRVSFERV